MLSKFLDPKHAEETTEEELQKLVEHDEIIGRAYGELDRYSWNEEELLTYEQAEKYEGAYLASLEKKFEDGEKAATLRIAKNMLRQGLKVQEVQKATGLSKQEVMSLKDFEP